MHCNGDSTVRLCALSSSSSLWLSSVWSVWSSSVWSSSVWWSERWLRWLSPQQRELARSTGRPACCASRPAPGQHCRLRICSDLGWVWVWQIRSKSKYQLIVRPACCASRPAPAQFSSLSRWFGTKILVKLSYQKYILCEYCHRPNGKNSHIIPFVYLISVWGG